MPFKNYSITKGGQLTIGQIMSPDFVHGISGWSINKDGSAEFHDIIIPAGSGGTVVTFAASAPGSPNVGDVWYDTAAGLLASQWNGAAWVPYSLSAGAIAAGNTINPNPYFAGGDVSTWAAGNGAAVAGTATSGGFQYPYAGSLTSAPGSAFPFVSGPKFPVNVGDPVQVTGWLNSNTADGALIVAFWDSGGGFVSNSLVNTGSGSTWELLTIAGTVPAGAASASISWGVVLGSTTGSEVIQATGMLVTAKINGTLIETGTLTPVFFYSGGALLMSVAAAAGTDPLTSTAYQAGAFVYGPNGSLIGMLDNGTFAELQMLPPGPVTKFTAHPAVLSFSVNAGAASEQMAAVLTSGQESSLDIASVLAYAEAADGSAPAGVAMAIGTGGFGSGIFATLTKTAFTLFGIPLVIGNQTIPGVQFIPSNAVHVSTNPGAFTSTVNPGAANEQLLTVLTSGKESSNDDAALQLFSKSADATVPAKAVIEFGGATRVTVTTPSASAPSGTMTITDALDGQVYNTQVKTIVSAGTSGTTLFTVFTATVAARTYRIKGKIFLNIGSNSTLTFRVNGPGSPSGQVGVSVYKTTALSAGFSYTGFNASSTISGTITAATGFILDFDGVITLASSGTLTIQIGESTGTLTVTSGSFLDIIPV